MYFERQLAKSIKRAMKQFPVGFLTGPRQSGKTTLLKHEFPHYSYVNLEDPELRLWATEQPKDFLHNHPWPLIIDEAQYAPVLFSYIQLIVDEHNKSGMFLLSGSQNFLLMEKITQSLAGRSAIMSLLPFSFNEFSETDTSQDTNSIILKGFFPRLFHAVDDVGLFYKSYINTYIERDIRQLANIGNLNDFIRFMKLCAGRSGQLLNMSSLATEAGIAHNTCKSWLSYLTTGYIVSFVQPHHRNFNKRIVKTPKLFFTDTGLLCYLLGINSKETLALHPLRGAVFENLIYTELLKYKTNHGHKEDIWFWRDNHGTEIDFLLGESTMLIAIEVKSGMNIQKYYFNNLKQYRKYNPELNDMYLIYDGEIERKKGDVNIINWRNISGLLGKISRR